MSGPRVRVCTLNIQPLLSLGLRAVFADQPDYEYIDDFTDYDQLLTLLKSDEMPTLLMFDFSPEYDGYAKLFSALRNANPTVRVLFFLPMALDDGTVLRALRTGADGYLLQSATRDTVMSAVAEIVSGRCYLQSAITPIVLEELRKPSHVLMEMDPHVVLTDRERLFLQLTADGLNNYQIAEVLGLAEKTVRNLWSELFDKLGISDRTQAVLWAIRTGQAELR